MIKMDIRQIDESKITSHVTKARPAEKSNEILMLEVDGKTFKCERPRYFNKRLDMSLFYHGYMKEGQIIYGTKIPVFYDQKGRWWCREELSSKGLMKFFSENPQRYIEIVTKKTEDIKELIKIAKELEKTVNSDDKKIIIENFEKLIHIFRTFYIYHFTTFVLFDELVFRFRELLNRYLPKKLANTYICEFLQAEITKEAIKAGAIGEKRGARDSTYSDDKPVVFYREPKLFFESKYDNEVLNELKKNKASGDEIKEFIALRIIVPISIQLSEEGQYLESKMFCAMMSIVINKISKILLDEGIIKEKDKVKDYTAEELINRLRDLDKSKLQDYAKHEIKHEMEHKEYIQSIYNAMNSIDMGTFVPFGWFEFHPLYAKESIDYIRKLIDKAESLNITPEELGKCVESVVALRVFHLYTLIDLKVAKIEKKERIKISNFFFEMIMARMVDDKYALKSNIIRNNNEIAELIKRINPAKATLKIAGLLGRIYNALYNLGAAIDFDIYLDYGLEVEGPYDVSNVYGPGRFLVIRKLMDLQANDLWPERKGIKPENVKIYTIYNNNVKFKTDFISAHTVFDGNAVKSMEHFMVDVDGQLISSETELKELLAIAEVQAIEQWNKVIKMDKESHKSIGLISKLLPVKKMMLHLGLEWKPTKEMIETVKGKSYVNNTFWNIPDNEKDKKNYFLKLYDPREEFYPGDSV